MRSLRVIGLLSFFVVVAAPNANGLASFGKVEALNADAASDGLDVDETYFDLATDGAGNWVAVWSSTDSLGDTIGSDADILVARSSDNGDTWSVPVALNTDADVDGGYDAYVELATDRVGTWVVIWFRGSGQVVTSRSADGGGTWSAPVEFGVVGLPGDVVSLGGAEWLALVYSPDDLGGLIGSDEDILMVRSTDGGVSWGSPSPVNTNAGSDTIDDYRPRLSTDGAGNLVAAWHQGQAGGYIVAAASSDNGYSWGSPSSVFAGSPNTYSNSVALATDRVGLWALVWMSSDSLSGTIGLDSDILLSTSTDNGATWSSATPVNSSAYDDLSNDTYPAIACDGLGTWYVAWTAGQNNVFSKTVANDGDLLVSRSTDDLATWTAPSVLNANAHRDKGYDYGVEFYFDGAARWLAVWNSDDDLDRTVGRDEDIFFAIADDDCPLTPTSGCLSTVSAGRSVVRLSHRTGGKDAVSWKWRGQQTLLGDFGDPTSSADYVLCVYDYQASVAELVMEADVSAAAMCRSKPCWRSAGGRFRFRDGRREHGAVSRLDLVPGDDDRARLQLRAKGPVMGTPSLPFAESPVVELQLLNLENGLCWEASYSNATINRPDAYKNRSE